MHWLGSLSHKANGKIDAERLAIFRLASEWLGHPLRLFVLSSDSPS